MAWAFARLAVYDFPLLEGISKRAVLKQFKPQEISNLLWAFASVKFSDEPFVETISVHVPSMGCDVFAAQHVANMAWAIAAMMFPDCHLMS